MINYSPVSLSYPIDWGIKTIPVYRILDDRQWMINFFEKGEIQVSSFNVFQNYKDEMQGDNSEGEAMIVFLDDEGNSHAIKYEAGLNAYILSTTKNLTPKVINDFKGKCAIKINDPTLFGLELSKKLPFITGGLEGSCDYVDSKIQFIEKHINTQNLINLLEKKVHNHHLQEELIQVTKGMELFAKDKKYQHQSEYRFAWFGRANISSKYIAYCPELIEYCEPIDL